MMKGVAGRITGWVRPQVPGASDGILASAGICEGFAGAIIRAAAIGVLSMAITYAVGDLVHP